MCVCVCVYVYVCVCVSISPWSTLIQLKSYRYNQIALKLIYMITSYYRHQRCVCS